MSVEGFAILQLDKHGVALRGGKKAKRELPTVSLHALLHAKAVRKDKDV